VVSAESIDTAGLPQLIYRLLPELASPGECAVLSGRFPPTQFSKGAMLIHLAEGVSYELELTNTGSGVLLTGWAHADATTDCTRCTDIANIRLEAEVEAYYILDPDDAEIADHDDSAVFTKNGIIDLAEPILASLVYELPFTVLCRDDCAGLCPRCYANLNSEECSCSDIPDPSHPLAALRTLLPDITAE
jgi:uncharacterized protein